MQTGVMEVEEEVIIEIFCYQIDIILFNFIILKDGGFGSVGAHGEKGSDASMYSPAQNGYDGYRGGDGGDGGYFEKLKCF